MGLIVELEFGNGIRRVEIDGHKNARFVDNAPVLPESWEAGFLKDYKEHGVEAVMHSRVGRLRDYWHDEWVETFVSAALEQGPESFDESMDEHDIAELLYGFAYNSDDYDYIQHVIKFENKDRVVAWMVDALVVTIETKGYHHPSAGAIARAMVGHVNSEDINIKLDESDSEYSSGRRSTRYAEYTISVLGRNVANWTEEAIYEIADPITFSGYVDEDYYVYPDGGESVRSNAIDFLSEFDLSLPEPSKPGPPDHPEPTEDGEYGVIHEYDERFDMMPNLAGTWEAVGFKSARDAMAAKDLAEEIYENISSSAHVTLTLVHRLTPEEMTYAEEHFDYMVAYAAMSGEPAPREWQREWKPIIEIDED